MKLIYNGKVKENGKLHIYRKNEFLKDILIFLGKYVVLTVEKKRKKRSLDQNAYYWAVVVNIIKDGLINVGYKVTKEETHEYLKSKFLIKELVNENTGEILKSTKSTTELTTSEFMDFMADVSQWAAEYLNINIPEPNEQFNFEF